MASRDWPRPEPRGLHRRRVLVQPRARRLAHQARRLHQDLAATLVRLEARQAVVVQGLARDPIICSTRRGPRWHVPDRERRRGRSSQALRLRALLQPRHHVLHRRFREREGGVDQLNRTVNRAALKIRHRLRNRRLR